MRMWKAHLFWSMSGGEDAEHFLLTEEGALSFKEVKDLDSPDDADGNGIYEITVSVDDGVHVVTADLEVRLRQEKTISSVATGSGGGGCGRVQLTTYPSLTYPSFKRPPSFTGSPSLTERGVGEGSPLGGRGGSPVSGFPGSGLPVSMNLLFFLGLMLFPALLVQWLRWSA